MKRLLLIAGGYLMTAIFSFVASVMFALLTVVAINPHDDSPVMGLIWFLLALLYCGAIVPLSLCWFALFVERRDLPGKSSWIDFVRRLPFVLVTSAGIIYEGWMGLHRPDVQRFWSLNLIVVCIISLAAAYFAFRIRRPSELAKPS